MCVMRSLKAGSLLPGMGESEKVGLGARDGLLGRRVEEKTGEPMLPGICARWAWLGAGDLTSPGFATGELNSCAPLPKERDSCAPLPKLATGELNRDAPLPKPENGEAMGCSSPLESESTVCIAPQMT